MSEVKIPKYTTEEWEAQVREVLERMERGGMRGSRTFNVVRNNMEDAV